MLRQLKLLILPFAAAAALAGCQSTGGAPSSFAQSDPSGFWSSEGNTRSAARNVAPVPPAVRLVNRTADDRSVFSGIVNTGGERIPLPTSLDLHSIDAKHPANESIGAF